MELFFININNVRQTEVEQGKSCVDINTENKEFDIEEILQSIFMAVYLLVYIHSITEVPAGSSCNKAGFPRIGLLCINQPLVLRQLFCHYKLKEL